MSGCGAIAPRSTSQSWGRRAAQTVHRRQGLRASPSKWDQSRFAFSFIAAWSFLMSSGDNCGRSTLMVSLLSLVVSGNGGL